MRTRMLVALGILLVIVQSPAISAEVGWFAGAGFGSSDRQDVGRQELDQPGFSIGSDVDGSDTGFKVFGGYRINRHFAFEAAYVDLGETGLRGNFAVNIDFPLPIPLPIPPLDFESTFDAVISVDGWSFSGVGHLPLGRGNFELLGKAGLYLWKADSALDAVPSFLPGAGPPGTTTFTLVDIAIEDDSGAAAVAGLGAQYTFSLPISLRLELERYFDTAGSDIDLISVGVLWSFQSP